MTSSPSPRRQVAGVPIWPRCLNIAVLLLLVSATAAGGAQPSPDRLAARVKAAFIYNFARFVEWPDKDQPSSGGALVLATLGSDDLTEALSTVHGKSVQGRTFEVRPLAPGARTTGCHLLYVARSEHARLETSVGRMEGRPVLTIGDSDDFIERGGIIRFFLENQSVRFEICPGRAESAGLKLSARLLQVARTVVCGPATR